MADSSSQQPEQGTAVKTPTDGVSRAAGDPGQTSKLKKRRNHRAGADRSMKKVNKCFNHDQRGNCIMCDGVPAAWSCPKCERTLPRGSFADFGLGAEDGDGSMFGCVRIITYLGILSPEEQNFFYQTAKELIQWFLNSEALPANSNSLGTALYPNLTLEQQKWEHQWREEALSAETRPDSIMGVFRRLLAHGLVDPQMACDWIWLVRSVGKSFIKVTYIFTHHCEEGLSQDFMEEGRLRLEKAIASYGDEPLADLTSIEMKKILMEKWGSSEKVDVGNGSEEPPSNSEDPVPNNGTKFVVNSKINPDSEIPQNGTKLKVSGQPDQVALTAEDLAEMVRSRNEELKAKEAETEQAKKNRQAEKDDKKARKARAQEQQREARQRKAAARREKKRLAKEARLDDKHSSPDAEQTSAESADQEASTFTGDHEEEDPASGDEVIVFKPRGRPQDR